MKYINVEELKREISKSPVWTGLDMISRINIMPTINIVRCKECKHWWKTTGANYGDCNHFRLDTLADAYCSYGEREGA